MPNDPCPFCGGEMRPKSRACNKRECQNARKRLERLAIDWIKECEFCGLRFASRRRDALFCSKACTAKGNSRPCLIDGCVRPHVAKGMCERHYKESRRETDPYYGRGPWNDSGRDAYHRRRARRAGAATGRPVRRAEIAERDGWICQLCHEPIDPDDPWPSKRSASMDHVIPLVEGGAHDPDNVQLTHLSCNFLKERKRRAKIRLESR